MDIIDNNMTIVCDCASSTFLEMVLSTFFGFGSALLVEAIVSLVRSIAVKKQLLKELIKELDSVVATISTLEYDQVYIKPYAIPVWQGACASGSILCLDKKVFYSKLLQVFASISEANLVEMKCSEIIISNNSSVDKQTIINILKTNREELLVQIKEGLKIIKEN